MFTKSINTKGAYAAPSCDVHQIWQDDLLCLSTGNLIFNDYGDEGHAGRSVEENNDITLAF